MMYKKDVLIIISETSFIRKETKIHEGEKII